MSSISAILKQAKVKRFQTESMANTSLTLNEQVTEFFTTNGDSYLLPYLTKYDKLSVTQGKQASHLPQGVNFQSRVRV